MAIVPDKSGNSVVGTVEHIPTPAELVTWAQTKPLLNTTGVTFLEDELGMQTLVADRPCLWSIEGGTDEEFALMYPSSQLRTTNVLVCDHYDFEDGPATVTIKLVDQYGNEDTHTVNVTVLNKEEVPNAFADGDWSITDNEDGTGATLELITLPAQGDSVITDVQYKLDDGDWTSVEAYEGTGEYPVEVEEGEGYNIVVRAINAVGAGPESNAKTFDVTDNTGGD